MKYLTHLYKNNTQLILIVGSKKIFIILLKQYKTHSVF